MKALTGIDAVLEVGAVGAFEVTVNDTLVFSKTKTKRFPEEGEVVELVSQLFLVEKGEKATTKE